MYSNAMIIMESSNKASRKSEKTRRCWSQKEEEVLISCLKEIVASGWKADNGFRVGYLGLLEHSMTKVFPGTNIRANPHINSKIHGWKRDYGSIVSILVDRTGVGWNDSTKMLEATDDMWDAAIKKDKNARLMRYKSWPYYHDWCEIFGKDRATGEQAEDVMDAVNELFNKSKDTENEKEVTDDIHILSDDFEDAMKENSTYKSVNNDTDKRSGGKKRKSTDENEGLCDLLGNFCRSTETRLGDIARRIGYEQDVSAARKEVFEAVGKIGGLTLQERLVVSKTLVNNTEDLDLFSSLPEDARAEFVHMMLAGKF